MMGGAKIAKIKCLEKIPVIHTSLLSDSLSLVSGSGMDWGFFFTGLGLVCAADARRDGT